MRQLHPWLAVVPLGSLAWYQTVWHLCHIISSRSRSRSRRRCVPHVVSSQQAGGIVIAVDHAHQHGQVEVGSHSHSGRRRCVPHVVSSQQARGIVIAADHAHQHGQVEVGSHSHSGRRRCVLHVVSSQQAGGIVIAADHAHQHATPSCRTKHRERRLLS